MNTQAADRVQVQREWIIAPPHPDRDQLARAARISPLMAQVLLTRGLESAGDVPRFLRPSWAELHPPAALPGAVEAGRLLAEAAGAGRRIVIYGDYDVDGITGAAILWHALRLARANVGYYVPRRLEEGYGLNADALASLAADGAAVIVTVDCGITACAEAELARSLGLALIITDHHEPRSTLPAADVIVHPTALGASANPHLSGSGVALKVAWAIAQAHSKSARVGDDFRALLQDLTALAALGLIADVVPLTGENRALASVGLRHLGSCAIPGVRALIEVAGLTGQGRYDDYDVGFKLAPRLNAAGRLGHAAAAVELFTTADSARAAEIARELDASNRQRQEVEREILSQAEGMVVERGFHRAGCRAVVLAHREWHAGVIGIVAARLVERFGRPAVLIALNGDRGQGSGRSVPHFPLHEVLGCCAAQLLSFGGHAMAAGIRIEASRIEAFTDALLGEAAKRLTEQDLRPKLRLDDEVELAQVQTDLVAGLQHLAPYGPGNARPRFATTAVSLVEPPRVVGQNAAHLQFTVRQGGQYRKAIAFGRAADCERLGAQRELRLAFEPILNEWNGRKSAELKVIDWQSA